MRLVNVIKDNLKTFSQKYQPLIQAGLSPEFVKGLGNGEWMIPAVILRREIETLLAGEVGVSLKRCDCHADGVHLALRLDRAGARITLPMTVRVSHLAIN